ncbi:MAG: DUF2207 domain-containing protein [Candidatus Kerfeldbacteria bacterium]|nr:DUF2207 domain-containing protein [Candidatus Kerfeldbacteria bacterium]
MIYKKIFFAIGALLVWFVPVAVAAETAVPHSEKITSFHSDITVEENSTLRVTETITVIANDINIRHGIYRDFPTVYPHPRIPFLRTTTGFTVQSVTKNGMPEPYTTRTAPNGKRVYIGDEVLTLDPGEYTYAITYTTNHQLYFGVDHDELFWNVTGNGWSFPISEASATVHLPSTISENDTLVLDGFTGAQGATEKNFTATVNKSGIPTFKTTTPLLQNEGFSIIIQFPKGHVRAENILSPNKLLRDNPELLITIIVVLYYLLLWFAIGRDPHKTTLIPLYEPPQNLSPAAARYIMRMSPGSEDKRGVAAAIINMGVKGWIQLSKEGKTYTLHKILNPKKQTPLSADEEALFNGLFKTLLNKLFHNENSVVLQQSNHLHISTAIDAFGDVLRHTYKKENFRTHTGYWLLGFLIASAVCIVPITLFHSVTAGTGILTAFLFILVIIFHFLLKAPTRAGQKLRREIEGFKWFLSVTEKERLAFAHPPKKTPELFEQFLPYALALGVENKWAQQFADVFAQMEKTGQSSGLSWYTGMHLAAFTSGHELSSFGSALTSTISSSAATPSSGRSGGGSSDGGGGGGGGGGW